MKSINLIENKGKKKKSKIKEAFKKIGEFTLIAATAFTLSCGGTETNGPEKEENVSMFTGEVKEFIDQNNYTERALYGKDFTFIHNHQKDTELSPLIDLFRNICSQNYPEIKKEFINLTGYDMALFYFNESEIKEVVFTEEKLRVGVNLFILNEDPAISYSYTGFKDIGGTYLTKFKYIPEQMKLVKHGTFNMESALIRGFSYLEDYSLLEENPQYFLPCNLAYGSSTVAILRAVMIPKDILDKKIEETTVSKELFYSRVEEN
jgi:hypothetical protein